MKSIPEPAQSVRDAILAGDLNTIQTVAITHPRFMLGRDARKIIRTTPFTEDQRADQLALKIVKVHDAICRVVEGDIEPALGEIILHCVVIVEALRSNPLVPSLGDIADRFDVQPIAAAARLNERAHASIRMHASISWRRSTYLLDQERIRYHLSDVIAECCLLARKLNIDLGVVINDLLDEQ